MHVTPRAEGGGANVFNGNLFKRFQWQSFTITRIEPAGAGVATGAQCHVNRLVKLEPSWSPPATIGKKKISQITPGAASGRFVLSIRECTTGQWFFGKNIGLCIFKRTPGPYTV